MTPSLSIKARRCKSLQLSFITYVYSYAYVKANQYINDANKAL